MWDLIIWLKYGNGFIKQRSQRDIENGKAGLQICVFVALCECVKTVSVCTYIQLERFKG